MTDKSNSKLSHAFIKNLEKLLNLLKSHKVKEYKSDDICIILDTVPYMDPNKLYKNILKEEAGGNPYGQTY